jgi:hypothetical protein
MKKLSTYARKMRRTDQTYNAAAWLNTLTKCRAYSDELLPGAIAKVPSFEAIRAMIIETRMAFERMKSGNGTSNDYDVLIVAFGEAKIRYAQMRTLPCYEHAYAGKKRVYGALMGLHWQR